LLRLLLAGRMVVVLSGAYDSWRKENYFCPQLKKLKALLSERSEFKCFEFYKRQK